VDVAEPAQKVLGSQESLDTKMMKVKRILLSKLDEFRLNLKKMIYCDNPARRQLQGRTDGGRNAS
jgi:hypothetical protein